MTIAKLMVGVDFSDESGGAVTQAMNLARHVGAELVLVHVGAVPDPLPHLPEAMDAAAREYRQILDEHLRDDRMQLEELRQRLGGQGVELSHMVIDGFPDKGICRAAADVDADIVVIGTHGRTGVKRFLLGSVAERVVRLCERNVLVARAGRGEGYGGCQRILVPTDFTENAERALEMALEVAATGATIEVLHCWQLAPLSFDVYAPTKSASETVRPMREAIGAAVQTNGAKLLEKYKSAHCQLEFRSMESPAARGVHDRLEDEQFDLVVMGSHGRRGIRRFLLGSVAEVTVRHAPCSVLVVHGGRS